MKTSISGKQVLIDREGFKLTAYKDSVGIWTIGVGHTSAAGPPEVKQGMTITEKEAMEIFTRDLQEFETAVDKSITVPMTENEYDAFVSICYNIGGGAFGKSTFVKSFNEKKSKSVVVAQILWFNIPKEIITRRQGEAVQFRDGLYVARIDPMPTVGQV